MAVHHCAPKLGLAGSTTGTRVPRARCTSTSAVNIGEALEAVRKLRAKPAATPVVESRRAPRPHVVEYLQRGCLDLVAQGVRDGLGLPAAQQELRHRRLPTMQQTFHRRPPASNTRPPTPLESKPDAQTAGANGPTPAGRASGRQSSRPKRRLVAFKRAPSSARSVS